MTEGRQPRVVSVTAALSALLHLLLLLPLHTGHVGAQVTCNAPSVEKGQTVELTCDFQDNMQDIEADLAVRRYVGDSTDAEELVDCYWMDGGYTCDVAEPSIMFVNNVTRYLKLSIRNAGTKDVGRYLCQRVQQGQPDPVSCPFSLTGGVTTTAGVDDTSTLSGDSDPNESATDFTDTSDKGDNGGGSGGVIAGVIIVILLLGGSGLGFWKRDWLKAKWQQLCSRQPPEEDEEMKATGPIYKGTAPPAEESQPMLEKQSQPASDETKAEGVLIRDKEDEKKGESEETKTEGKPEEKLMDTQDAKLETATTETEKEGKPENKAQTDPKTESKEGEEKTGDKTEDTDGGKPGGEGGPEAGGGDGRWAHPVSAQSANSTMPGDFNVHDKQAGGGSAVQA